MTKLHVRHCLHIRRESWCGIELPDFEKHFKDIEHLLTYARLGGDKSFICSECGNIIFDTIKEAVYVK